MFQTHWAMLLRIGIVYFILAALAIRLTRYDGGIALLWFGTSYLIAEMSEVRRRSWPAQIMAAAVGNVLATGLLGLGWTAAVPLTAANMLEAWTASYLLRQRARQVPLESLRWFGQFTIAVVLIAPLISAPLAALAGVLVGRPADTTFLHFFTGHALSNLTFVPIALLIVSGEILQLLRRFRTRRAETVGLMTLSIVTTTVSFNQQVAPLLFLPILPIILLAFRLGRGAAAASILFLALIGGASTLAGQGPIQALAGSEGLKAQFFQFYLAMTVLTVWPVAADLRNRARLHRRLRLSEARYRLIADHSSDILMQLGRDGTIQYVSPSIQQLGGYDSALLVGRIAAEIIAPEDRDEVSAWHNRTMAEPGRTFTFEYRAMTADGRKCWFETHAQALVNVDGSVTGTISIIRDVGERKAKEQSLARAALTDPLTGLPNRRAFGQIVAARKANSSPTGDTLALIDIDHFKRVNDRWGHEVGDQVLQRFAEVVRTVLRQSDHVARMGGEEFAILFPATSVSEAMAICERLRHLFSTSELEVDGSQIRVTLSGGVAAIGAGGLQPALKAADAALYRAKNSGRDQLACAD